MGKRILQSKIKKDSFKKVTFCPNFKVFSFDFSEEIISELKPLKTSSILVLSSAGVKNRYSLKQHFIINFGFTLKMLS